MTALYIYAGFRKPGIVGRTNMPVKNFHRIFTNKTKAKDSLWMRMYTRSVMLQEQIKYHKIFAFSFSLNDLSEKLCRKAVAVLSSAACRRENFSTAREKNVESFPGFSVLS